MSNNANQTKVEAVREFEAGVKTDNYEFSISLPESNVAKILSASASIQIDNLEVLSGEINYSGKACLNLVYELEDGEMSSYKVCENFSGKFENPIFTPTEIVDILPNLIDITIDQASGDGVKVKIRLENKFVVTQNQEILSYSPDEDIFVKENEILLTKQKARSCQNFDQKTIFEPKIPVKKILNISSGALINKADALDGLIVFEGDLMTKILYYSNEEEPRIITLSTKQPFREEVEETLSTKESFVEACAKVQHRDVEAKIDSETNNIEIDTPIRLCYEVFETMPIKVVNDAFSTNNEINLTTEAFLSNKYLGLESFSNKIDGNITIDEEALRIDKILAVDGAYITQTNLVVENGEILIEGLLHTNIIYLNDEENTINSVTVETPFSVTEKIGVDTNNLLANAYTEVTEIDATVKRGREIYLDAKTTTTVWLQEETQIAIVSGIEIADAVAERDSAIEIYFANAGQTFWDVAKDLKVPQEILRQQNNTIVEPFVDGDKIVYYYQKVTEF